MHRRPIRHLAAALAVAAGAFAALPGSVSAARVAIVSNYYQNETAAAFAANIPGHSFTPVDVSLTVPSLEDLTARFDVLLLFEDSTFANAPNVGNVVASFARSGHPVVLGTFYDQDRSDGPPSFSPHGWGALETIDPNQTDGTGTAYSPRTLDAGSIVPHPLTAGVTALRGNKFVGGNQAKPGTTVVANWLQRNARGGADPAIAFRISNGACVIHIAIAPQYPAIDLTGTEYGGDFYRVWQNAFDFGANHCITGVANLPGSSAIAVPALSNEALAAMALLVAASAAAAPLVRRRR
jgi:hypothetical protein